MNAKTDFNDLASAEERFATLAEIMRRLESSDHVDRTWRQACLDTRQHVRFYRLSVQGLPRRQVRQRGPQELRQFGAGGVSKLQVGGHMVQAGLFYLQGCALPA